VLKGAVVRVHFSGSVKVPGSIVRMRIASTEGGRGGYGKDSEDDMLDARDCFL